MNIRENNEGSEMDIVMAVLNGCKCLTSTSGGEVLAK